MTAWEAPCRRGLEKQKAYVGSREGEALLEKKSLST